MKALPYYPTNSKEYHKIKDRIWWWSNIELHRLRHRQVCKKSYHNNERHKRRVRQWAKSWAVRYENKQKILRAAKKRRQKTKNQVLSFYSNGKPKCSCCGEKELVFLTLDHLHNDGASHRRQLGIKDMYRWVVKNNYPNMFQVLCMNCNLGKRLNGLCPHTNH